MLQHYRLRLGDGTILQVDREGLQAWVKDDRRAMVQVAGTSQWRPLREFLAEEESAARLARALVPPEPRRSPAPAPAPLVVEPPRPAFEPAIGEPPVQALAEEPSAPVVAPWQVPPEAPGPQGPAIRLKPLEDEPHTAADEPDVIEEQPQDPYAVPTPLASYAAARVEEEEEEEDEPRDRLEGPLLQVVSAFGTLLSRLLDPLTPLVRDWPPRSSPAERTPRAAARRAAARVQEASVASAPTPSVVATLPPAEPPPAPEPPAVFEPPSPRREPPPRTAPSPPVSVLAEDPVSTAGARPGREEDVPVIPLKPLDEGERMVTAAWQVLSEKVSGWVAGASDLFTAVTAWLAGLWERLQHLRERDRRPESVVPAIEPAPRRVPPATPRVPASAGPAAPRGAPTPIAELPSIRLAAGWEAPEEGDVYDGEVETWSVLPIAWMWTKRIVLVGGLVAVVALGAVNWETWFPRAAELGQTVFTEIDRQAHSAQRAREREQAFANAAEQCPHLAPATIRLVLSTSSEGVLQPPDVFQAATEAADRGIGALAPEEASELQALQRELVANLRPAQRARLAEYDRARATREVFPFENPHALDLVARGARAMPDARRARLQVLVGKAVAAGLGLPPPPRGSGPGERVAP